ncbi:hypothetical protein G6F60_015152 [Rhizopus arrhizus]|nr:hypothetical protein G6F60_015152 [Rhizopus arrhizus]
MAADTAACERCVPSAARRKLPWSAASRNWRKCWIFRGWGMTVGQSNSGFPKLTYVNLDCQNSVPASTMHPSFITRQGGRAAADHDRGGRRDPQPVGRPALPGRPAPADP